MIEIHQLRVVLPPANVILDGVDLSVTPGEFVVILGRSGAGKTTLLRTINRLVEPSAGTVRVDGREVTGAAPHALREIRRRIGMIFQQFNLVRRISVLENVLAGRLGYVPAFPSLLGRFPADARKLALDGLAQVGLAHFADRRADTLSGGEQQRVAIARALAQSPAVILADEPTASLDQRNAISIAALLHELAHDTGAIVLCATHDHSVIAQADTVIELVAGAMVCVLLPAVMLLMGRHTWWLPRRLDRVLPHISVEGEPHPQPA